MAAWLVAAACAAHSFAPLSIDLGRGRSMLVHSPAQHLAAENAAVASILGVGEATVAAQRAVLSRFEDATGQKVWPSSRAFARLLHAQPSLVTGFNVLELGCGLGTVGIAAALAGARSVVLTDSQPESLELAAAAAEANGVGERTSTRLLDWTAPGELGEALGERDPARGLVVVGSDVLYDCDLARSLVGVVAGLLPPRQRGSPEPRCLLVDPPHRPARGLLRELCAEAGLYWGGEIPVGEAEERGTVLISVLRE